MQPRHGSLRAGGGGRGVYPLPSTPLHSARAVKLNGGFAGGQTTVPWDGSARLGTARLGVAEASQASSPASLDAQPAYKTMDSLECIQQERERERDSFSRTNLDANGMHYR